MALPTSPRTILVHDFVGHPFQAELSRALADDGDVVVHAYCSGTTTGQGDLTRRAEDPPGLRFIDLHPEVFERYSWSGRLRGELRYGHRAANLTRALRPDVVLSANAPLLVQASLWLAARMVGATRVYWLQDFLGIGTRLMLTARSRLLGMTVGALLEGLERLLLRRSHGIVAISEDFLPAVRDAGASPGPAVRVVENWASLGEITVLSKSNSWSRDHGVDQSLMVLYSGTLGLKHDPDHLVEVAIAIADVPATLVVVSEGVGRDALEVAKRARAIDNLLLLDYVDYERLPEVLASADLCLVLLEPDAGVFSVPSKVLSYLAAGRAIAGAIPPANLAARTIERAGAGVVVTPGDHEAFASTVRSLLTAGDELEAMGARARTYAEETFDIVRIREAFRAVFRAAEARSKA